MARRSLPAQEEQAEINLAPMIDCIFILLIFFIVTTVFVEEKGLQVHKPDAAMPSSLEEGERVVIEIDAESNVLVGRHKVGLEDVVRRVQAGIEGPETPVVIRAHEKSRHATFVAVWDAAKRGGAQTLSFTTVN